MAKRILIVDDEPDVLKVLSLRLQKTGYEVTGARDGQEALDAAHRVKPDLIILDIYLPKIDGDDVTRILKSEEAFKNTPMILISATTRSASERAMECGADGCLNKPFEPEELMDMIAKNLK